MPGGRVGQNANVGPGASQLPGPAGNRDAICGAGDEGHRDVCCTQGPEGGLPARVANESIERAGIGEPGVFDLAAPGDARRGRSGKCAQQC